MDDNFAIEQLSKILAEVRALREENKEIKEQLHKLSEKQEVVQSFLSVMTEAQDFSKTMEAVEKVTMQLTGAGKVSFSCYDNVEGKFFTADDGNKDYRNADNAEKLSEIKALAEAFESNADWKVFEQEDGSVLVPVVSNDGNVLGVISAEKEGGFSAGKEEFEQFRPKSEILNTIDLALKKEAAHQLSVTDELTKLKNRDGLNEYLPNVLLPRIGDGKPVVILMCDIDHFKNVNDTYGHDAGDVVLRDVADILKQNTRSGEDCAFRFGGEEMLVILACEPEKALERAEDILSQIRNSSHTVEYNGQPTEINVTISMGVYQIDPSLETEMTPQNVRAIFDSELKKADELLYDAKEGGRDQLKTTPELYNAFLVNKSAQALGVSVNEQAAVSELSDCILNDENDIIVEAVSAVNSGKTKDIRTAIENKENKVLNVYEKIGNTAYKDIPDKVYISKVSKEQLDKIVPAFENKNIKFSGVQRDNGSYTLTVGKADEKSAKGIFFPVRKNALNDRQSVQPDRTNEKTADAKKEPVIFNKEAYKNTNNKTFINTDAKTAYVISKAAEKSGVEFSTKFNGAKSTVTIDGVKNAEFLNKLQKITDWADKIKISVQKNIDSQNKGNGAR